MVAELEYLVADPSVDSTEPEVAAGHHTGASSDPDGSERSGPELVEREWRLAVDIAHSAVDYSVAVHDIVGPADYVEVVRDIVAAVDDVVEGRRLHDSSEGFHLDVELDSGTVMGTIIQY